MLPRPNLKAPWSILFAYTGVIAFLPFVFLLLSGTQSLPTNPDTLGVFNFGILTLFAMFIASLVFLIQSWLGIFGKTKTIAFPSQSQEFAVALSFVLGFAAWYGLASFSAAQPQSVVSFTTLNVANTPFATFSGYLDEFGRLFVLTVMAPIIEELMFLNALPVAILILLAFFARTTHLKFLDSNWLGVLAVVGVTAPLFALYHVGQEGLVAFFIAASVFRGLMLFLYWGDWKLNVVPLLTVMPTFAIGAHMANNIVSSGVSVWHWLAVMSSVVWGWFVVGWLLAIVVTLVYGVKDLVEKRSTLAKLAGA